MCWSAPRLGLLVPELHEHGPPGGGRRNRACSPFDVTGHRTGDAWVRRATDCGWQACAHDRPGRGHGCHPALRGCGRRRPGRAPRDHRPHRPVPRRMAPSERARRAGRARARQLEAGVHAAPRELLAVPAICSLAAAPAPAAAAGLVPGGTAASRRPPGPVATRIAPVPGRPAGPAATCMAPVPGRPQSTTTTTTATTTAAAGRSGVVAGARDLEPRVDPSRDDRLPGR
jgi:hypothetical protein